MSRRSTEYQHGLADQVEDLLAIDPGPIERVALRLRTTVAALRTALERAGRRDLLAAMTEHKPPPSREWKCGSPGCRCDREARRQRERARTAVPA